MHSTTLCGGLCQTALWRSSQSSNVASRNHRCPHNRMSDARQHQEVSMPYSLRIVCTSSLTSRSYFRVVRRDPWLIILIGEDLKVLEPFADVNTNAALM